MNHLKKKNCRTLVTPQVLLKALERKASVRTKRYFTSGKCEGFNVTFIQGVLNMQKTANAIAKASREHESSIFVGNAPYSINDYRLPINVMELVSAANIFMSVNAVYGSPVFSVKPFDLTTFNYIEGYKNNPEWVEEAYNKDPENYPIQKEIPQWVKLEGKVVSPAELEKFYLDFNSSQDADSKLVLKGVGEATVKTVVDLSYLMVDIQSMIEFNPAGSISDMVVQLMGYVNPFEYDDNTSRRIGTYDIEEVIQWLIQVQKEN